MTTSSAATGVLRSLIENNTPANPQAGGPAIQLRWRGEMGGALPDKPAPFIYTLFSASRSSTIEIGGGRGRNRHRNPGYAEIYIFVPQRWGLQAATDIAEALAAAMRPQNADGVTVDDATVYPGGPGSEIAVPGMDAEVGNYNWSACGVSYHFDLIG